MSNVATKVRVTSDNNDRQRKGLREHSVHESVLRFIPKVQASGSKPATSERDGREDEQDHHANCFKHLHKRWKQVE